MIASTAASEVYGHVNNIAQGASISQILSVAFLGALFIIGTFWLIWKIMDFRLQPLADVPKTLVDIKVSLSKLWSEEQLNDKIKNQVNEAVHTHETEYHRRATIANSHKN